MENSVELKTISDISGMNFLIPSYQRGYRWGEQQVIDLLDDIYSFSKNHSQGDEIYCIQPLVVAQRDEDVLEKCKRPETTLEDIRRYIKGSWTVVDGQQRLTTIYLILKAFDVKERYEIEYATRKKSKEFLKDINNEKEDKSYDNIDFYHMYEAFDSIKKWKEKHNDNPETFRSTLLNRVVFIWYKVDEKEEVKVFQRLNIGKIPLTDSELIKALFLNRSNFGTKKENYNLEIESLQKKIAFEWDMIERELQNDEFWAFINNFDYSRPTRIDFILDAICEKNIDKLGKESVNKIGRDEHKTFRYFNEKFIQEKENGTEWINNLWSEIKEYYQVFNEWYHDYRLYHYIGYLSALSCDTSIISELVLKWNKNNKEDFLNYIKGEIKSKLEKESTKWLSKLESFEFDIEGSVNKRKCIGLLLLYNIETIIQQNEKLVEESRYNLPNFTKFPFHLFKKEKWEVEHIRPNAGDDLKDDDAKKTYLLLAKQYIEKKEIKNKIDSFLGGNTEDLEFSDLLNEVIEEGKALADKDKNKLWNFTLLDATTNKEYGNQIFPVKRAFINNKVNGIKRKYKLENNMLKVEEEKNEVAFVPLCTQNVFAKSNSLTPTTMVNWTEDDAKSYLQDIKIKLKDYLPEQIDMMESQNE